MADEIEEFLRRAAQRRAAQQQAAQQAAQQPQAYQPPPPPPQRPALAQQQSAYVEPVEVEVVYDDEPSGARVASQVAQNIDNRQFSERARQLGEQVGLADDNMDAHLHQTFDHHVGQLRSTTAATAMVAPSPSYDEARQGVAGAAPAGAGDAAAQAAGVSAADIAQLLRTPRNIRNAIILSEILARPEHRW